MKVVVKESYKEAEEKFYKIPQEERINVIFFSCMDFISGKEYEVLSIEKNGWYRIIDESEEDYIFPPTMFDVVDDSPCREKTEGIGLYVKYCKMQSEETLLKQNRIYSVSRIDENENYIIEIQGSEYAFPSIWFELVAWIDDGEWQNFPSVLYQVGMKELSDFHFDKAVYFFQKGAKMDDERCKNALQDCFAKKEEKDKLAYEYFRHHFLFAKKGERNSQFEVGKCFENGWGIKKNLKKAVRWYKKAAKKNHLQAIYNLAYCYDNGIGIRKNAKKARRLLEKTE